MTLRHNTLIYCRECGVPFEDEAQANRHRDLLGPDHLDRCFVLRPERDPFAIFALKAYAQACEGAYPQLAADLREWIGDE